MTDIERPTPDNLRPGDLNTVFGNTPEYLKCGRLSGCSIFDKGLVADDDPVYTLRIRYVDNRLGGMYLDIKASRFDLSMLIDAAKASYSNGHPEYDAEIVL